MSHLCLHNGVYHACFSDVVILGVDLSVLKRVVYYIGPIELTVCEILKGNLHDAASH